MNDREKYLFDLQGFLVVKNFLTDDEVARLNEAFDANQDKMGEDRNSNIGSSTTLAGFKRGMFSGMLTWEHPWCEPFRDLLAHPKSVPYLNTIHGRGWRMDHSPFMLQAEAGAEGLILHDGGYQFGGPTYYTYKNGRIRCGMVVLQFQLADINEGDGGFCCIPGSHKANFPTPTAIAEWTMDQDVVYNVPCKAGDLLVFNESTTHGTLPWRAKHRRRSLLYRYSPKYLHYAGGYHQTTMPEWVDELTPAQRAVLEPPYVYNRPLIDEDGSIIRPLVG
ncbi:MAG TPA: phytanoyl-CoA dioxygenase family protein [Armatimonadota bacterium]|nr:phytanoyl-CoA dioxygenase family protein [Armatimonadota bacterium]